MCFSGHLGVSGIADNPLREKFRKYMTRYRGEFFLRLQEALISNDSSAQDTVNILACYADNEDDFIGMYNDLKENAEVFIFYFEVLESIVQSDKDFLLEENEDLLKAHAELESDIKEIDDDLNTLRSCIQEIDDEYCINEYEDEEINEVVDGNFKDIKRLYYSSSHTNSEVFNVFGKPNGLSIKDTESLFDNINDAIDCAKSRGIFYRGRIEYAIDIDGLLKYDDKLILDEEVIEDKKVFHIRNTRYDKNVIGYVKIPTEYICGYGFSSDQKPYTMYEVTKKSV